MIGNLELVLDPVQLISPLTMVLRHVWFVNSIATLCLTFLAKISYSIWTTNLRQSVTHLATNQTCFVNLYLPYRFTV
jgi:hypothetical protein